MLSQPLLDSQNVEMIKIENDNDIIEIIKDIHNKIIKNNYNTTNIEHELIEILGGIDNIITLYLKRYNEFEVNSDILNQLCNLLSLFTKSEYKPKSGPKHIKMTRIRQSICFYRVVTIFFTN